MHQAQIHLVCEIMSTTGVSVIFQIENRITPWSPVWCHCHDFNVANATIVQQHGFDTVEIDGHVSPSFA